MVCLFWKHLEKYILPLILSSDIDEEFSSSENNREHNKHRQMKELGLENPYSSVKDGKAVDHYNGISYFAPYI